MSSSLAPRLALVSALLVAALLASLGAPTSTQAQSRQELAQARDLFTQGLEAARDRRWIDARGLFERSLEITERASTLLNLAAALAETGALVESTQRYERFLEIATPRDMRRRGTEARRALELVRGRTPQLSLETSQLLSGDSVEIDGEPVATQALAEPLLLDPGSHHVTVSRAGAVVFEEHISLAEGRQEQLTLAPEAVPSPDEVAAAAVETSPGGSAPIAAGGDDGLAIGIGIGVGAAVLAAVAILVAVVLVGEQPANGYMGNLGGGVIRY